jgi:hypothetical protein
VVSLDALGDERLDVRGQLTENVCPLSPREFAEGERDRHTTPDALGAVTLVNEPGDVRFDLGANPRPVKAIDRRWLHEVFL